jgi:hypothetical protein
MLIRRALAANQNMSEFFFLQINIRTNLRQKNENQI